MRMPDAGEPPGGRWMRYLRIVVAGCSLGLGVLGAVILLKVRSPPADQPQPYIYSERDLLAEKLIQQRKLAEMEVAAGLTMAPSPPVAAAAAAAFPPVEVAAARPPDERTESSGTRRPPRQGPGRRPDPPAIPKPTATPDPAAAKPVPASDEVLKTYVTDAIADTRIDLQGMASRMAVAEADLKRMQETRSLFEWCTLLVTFLAALQGIAVLVLPFVNNRRKPDILHRQEASSSG